MTFAREVGGCWHLKQTFFRFSATPFANLHSVVLALMSRYVLHKPFHSAADDVSSSSTIEDHPTSSMPSNVRPDLARRFIFERYYSPPLRVSGVKFHFLTRFQGKLSMIANEKLESKQSCSVSASIDPPSYVLSFFLRSPRSTTHSRKGTISNGDVTSNAYKFTDLFAQDAKRPVRDARVQDIAS